jgi:4-hydroxy-4-methyl-2-oxoglutarate aldolase
VVCADDDGVVVVARDEAGWALERARERVAKEDGTRARLAAGELGLDIYGLRATLEALGVEYIE